MTREEAKTVFLNRGYVEVEGGTIYDADKWRESCRVISEWLEQEPTTVIATGDGAYYKIKACEDAISRQSLDVLMAQADGEKTCGTCRNEDTYHCAECENKSDYEQAQADGEYITQSAGDEIRQKNYDSISRQAVMDALCNDCELFRNGEQTCFTKCEEYHFLATLPPVKPQPKWIPVSERLPEKNMHCLVSAGKLLSTQIAIYSDLMGTIDHKIFYQGDYGHENFVDITEYVKAWMPLPEPYKAERSDKEKLSWLGKNCKDCGNEKCKKLGTLPQGYDCALWQAESEDKE